MGDFRGHFWALLFLVLLAGCGSSNTDLTSSTSTTPPAPTETAVVLSGTSFNFGEYLVGDPATQTTVTVNNTGKIPL
ncbi:MAG: hypothetical protein ABSF34_18485, partial [Verrucomicrobiota bacterium]